MKWIGVSFLMLFAACTIDGDKQIDRNKFTFKTGSDTQLFFKNVRQSYYDLEENETAKFQVFRFSKRSKDGSKPLLNFTIINNYLNDEAYLLFEPNELVGELPLSITSSNDSADVSRIITLAAQNRETTLHFATDIYEDLVAGNSFQLKAGDSLVDVLNTYDEQEALRITISDYYRLTRVY